MAPVGRSFPHRANHSTLVPSTLAGPCFMRGPGLRERNSGSRGLVNRVDVPSVPLPPHPTVRYTMTVSSKRSTGRI
jgi:hypothetical protein